MCIWKLFLSLVCVSDNSLALVQCERASSTRVCVREYAHKTAQSLRRRASEPDSRAAQTILSWSDGRVWTLLLLFYQSSIEDCYAIAMINKTPTRGVVSGFFSIDLWNVFCLTIQRTYFKFKIQISYTKIFQYIKFRQPSLP